MIRTISNVIIEKLFGFYDYNFLEGSLEKQLSEDMLILYGDNGSGKTSILKAIFFLLSTNHNQGHKSELANIKFKKISVYFTDGLSVHAIRSKADVGSFQMLIENNGIEIGVMDLRARMADSEYLVYFKQEDAIEQGYYEILEGLEKAIPQVYYLSDSRRLFSFSDDEILDEIQKRNAQKQTMRELAAAANKIDFLEVTLGRLTGWIKEQNLEGSKKGEYDTNEIYKEIIKQINSSNLFKEKEVLDGQLEALTEKLLEAGKKSEDYSKFGLLNTFGSEEIYNLTLNTSPEKQVILLSVLEPFINSLEARISALKDVFESLNTLINNLNDYYFKNKKISFHIDEGFSIKYLNGDELNPKLLSSGEKQLLLLLCNVLLNKDDSRIFIIDEPEISLNIKWQRNILDTLKSLDFKKNTQFIIASHSMEVLSTHRNNVIKLNMHNRG